MRATGKTAKRRKMNAETIKVELGSGNVFADIGLKDADELLLKAKLVAKISQLIEKKGLTQAEIAKRTGLDQPKVSRLLNGQLSGFSADRLFAVLNRLGHSVEVRISVKERPPEKSHTRVMLA
jgi:predicted XRE-type DNA-binding protein